MVTTYPIQEGEYPPRDLLLPPVSVPARPNDYIDSIVHFVYIYTYKTLLSCN